IYTQAVRSFNITFGAFNFLHSLTTEINNIFNGFVIVEADLVIVEADLPSLISGLCYICTLDS
ncbi:MAG: hypothetical protein PSN34_05935, partial [Urechidicola sp.]|nr:hypothetical protein [Urechidicola sp.]